MGQFTGWMLLSYDKPVRVSSALNDFGAEALTDENIKTYWVAVSNDAKQWVEMDLLTPQTVYAIQANYNDYQSGMYGRIPNLHHRFRITSSTDGKTWTTVADRSNSDLDAPNAYLELPEPVTARYLRYENVEVTSPNLSISDFRVFGLGKGKQPGKVKKLRVTRAQDRREAMVSWDARKDCNGYNILWGIAPDKLYSSWLVYGQSELLLRSLNTDQKYYFAIEAFNESGISGRSDIVKVE
jgi:hypothetical protein